MQKFYKNSSHLFSKQPDKSILRGDKRSFIYKNIFWYRLLMQVIYGGKYQQRFDLVIKHIPTSCTSILELCFGDLVIANYCKANNVHWIGYDSNRSFVDNAKKKGFNGILKDVLEAETYPKVDMVIMIGSLYHFHKNLTNLFFKMTQSANHIIISEPIKNFSSMRGPIGYLSKKASNAGKGRESFRYTKETLLSEINSVETIKDYEVRILHQSRDLIIELWRI